MMRLWFAVAVVTVARLPASDPADYAGDFCTAVVDFPVANVMRFAETDAGAKGTFGYFPR